MASITFNFRPSSKDGVQAGSLFLRMIHRRKVLSITTPYRIYSSEWDQIDRTLVFPAGESNRTKYLLDVEDRMNRDLRRLAQIVETLERQGYYTVSDIVRNFRVATELNTLTAFAEKLASDLCKSAQERTARAYRTAVAGLILFNKEQDIRLEHINSSLIRAFEKDMKQRGKSMNTISFYMRNLRAIYNKAIAEGRIQPRLENPFMHVYTGVCITKKRALTKEEVKLLSNLDLKLTDGNHYKQECKKADGNPKKTAVAGTKSVFPNPEPLSPELQKSLALFMFCFHARGMSFVDMAYLTRENIKNGTITYFRKKTGQLLEVKVNPAMQSIIDFFAEETRYSNYIFPVITDPYRNRRQQYENGLRLQNSHLKRLAKIAGIDKIISTHVARHSWATIAKKEKLPLWVISEGLGHSNEKMTYTYLASFDRSVIDKASDQISKAIRKAV